MGSGHAKLVEVIRSLTGVNLEEDKLYLLDSRLGEIVKEYGLCGFAEMALKLEKGGDTDFIRAVVDKITTHETRFFRDESIFDGLIMQIIPEWMRRNGVSIGGMYGSALPVYNSGDTMTIGDVRPSVGRRLSIWSAACSTGQEPYSVAMLLQEKAPLLAKITDIHATDISRLTIDRAREGIYTRFEISRGLPDLYLKKYFTKLDENRFQVNEDIRSRVQFSTHNLINEVFPSQNDIVLCRNVSIYFIEEQKRRLYENLRRALRSDGVLILGSAESLSGYIDDFIIREYGLGRYYELNASQVFMF